MADIIKVNDDDIIVDIVENSLHKMCKVQYYAANTTISFESINPQVNMLCKKNNIDRNKCDNIQKLVTSISSVSIVPATELTHKDNMHYYEIQTMFITGGSNILFAEVIPYKVHLRDDTIINKVVVSNERLKTYLTMFASNLSKLFLDISTSLQYIPGKGFVKED